MLWVIDEHLRGQESTKAIKTYITNADKAGNKLQIVLHEAKTAVRDVSDDE